MVQTATPALIKDLESRRDEIIERMLMATEPPPNQPPEDRRQFLAGYLDLLVNAARGNVEPRDAYLEVVIPGVKSSGMDYGYVLAQMTGVAMAVASVVSREHLPWHFDFSRDYTARLTKAWQRA